VTVKRWFIIVLCADLLVSKTILDHTYIYVHSDPLEKHDSVKLFLSAIKQIFCTRTDKLSAVDRYVAVHNLKCQVLDGLRAFPHLKYLILFERTRTLPTTTKEIPNLRYLCHLTLSKIDFSNIDTLFS